MQPHRFKAIAAVSENGYIGVNGRIPWHVPGDFRWFKQTTMGGLLIMGRKTFESIGRPLPGRETLILSRAGSIYPGTRTFKTVAELDAALASDPRPIWVCGGEEIYRLLLPRCGEIVLSRIHLAVEGDAMFPSFTGDFEYAAELHREPEFHVELHRRKAAAPGQ